MDDNLARFVKLLQRPDDVRRSLIAATELLESDDTTEFGRVVCSLGIDVGGGLRATAEDWRPRPDDPNQLAEFVTKGCVTALRDLAAPEVSSAALAHVLLRFNSDALVDVSNAIRATQVVPPLVTISGVARAAVQLTRASVLSWALDASDGVAAAEVEATDRELSEAVNAPFARRVFDRIAKQQVLPGQSGQVSSKTVLRAALSLGSEQRVASWLKSTSLNPVSFLRDEAAEGPTRAFRKHSLTQPAIASVCLAHRLSEISDQHLNVDRLVLACLATPGSFLERHVRSVLGRGVNLPLVYLRSAHPGALSEPECQYIVALGDRQADPTAAPVTGDISIERFKNMAVEAGTTGSSFDAARRVAAFLGAAGTLPDSLYPVADLQRRGVLTSGLSYIAAATVQTLGTAAIDADSIAQATADAVNTVVTTSPQSPGAALFHDLFSSNPKQRLYARQRLLRVRSDDIGFDVLNVVRPRLDEECLTAAEEGDALRVATLVRTGLALNAGAAGRRVLLEPRGVSLFIGGGPNNYAVACVSDGAGDAWTVSLAEDEMMSEWSTVRSAALSNNPVRLRDVFAAYGERVGLDRIANLLNEKAVELFVVSPFDSLYLDLAIRSLARPVSVVYRLLGGGTGRWRGKLSALARSGGRRLIVADPTATLRGASLEGMWLAGQTGGELVTGPTAVRAHLLRSLESDAVPPQLLHFAGHGVSGLVDITGHVVSGVLVGEGEVVTASMLSGDQAPGVLVASACDIGCLPPVAHSRGWHSGVLRAGVGYSLAASIPVADLGALTFSLLLYRRWMSIDDLELAMAETVASGQNPSLLRSRIKEGVDNWAAREACLGWLDAASEADVKMLFESFSIASA